MKTTLELVDAMYLKIKASPLNSAVNGNVFKYQKPKAHTGEAVVINSLPVTNTQVQTGLLNLNVFVPNKALQIGSITDEGQPDGSRLTALSQAAKDALESWYEDGTDYEVEAQTLFPDEESSAYYINFRVRVYSLNIA